jgi:hypothetical protein
MEFYSAIKRNKILSFAGKWMELENIILSEVIQVQKAKGSMFSLIVEDKSNTNTSTITYTYEYIQNMLSKVGLSEETEEETKKRIIE